MTTKRPIWFDACIIGAVFSTVLLAATAFVGFFTFLLNVIVLGMFIAAMVQAVKDGDVGGSKDSKTGHLQG